MTAARDIRAQLSHPVIDADGHQLEFEPLGHERYDWSSFVERPVETIEVPGNHFSLVNEPHVAALDRVLEGIP